MSGKVTTYDFDDDTDWIHSFSPDFSSTQEANSGKRQAEEILAEKSKTIFMSTGAAIIKPAIKKFCEDSQSKSKNDFCVNKVVKRVFPGPAGLLPDRMEKNKSISELVSEDLDEDCDDIQLCSQRSVSEFEEGPWKKMAKDFSLSNAEQLYGKFNISWIKKNSGLKKAVVSYKAPFLASVIHSIEVMEGKIPTINVTLKDSTGVIGGTISHSLYEEFADYFTVGSVLVLRQFGILSVGDSYCVTITPTNLLSIYPKVVPKKLSDMTETGVSIGRIVKHQISAEEIWNKFNEDLEENSKRQNNLKKINGNSKTFLKYPSNRVKTSPASLNSGSIHAQTFSKISGLCEPVQTVSYNNHLIEPNTTSEVSHRVASSAHPSKKFDFKKTGCSEENKSGIVTSFLKNINAPEKKESDNIRMNCSQLLVQANEKHTEIWKNLFEEVDADSLFDEF